MPVTFEQRYGTITAVLGVSKLEPPSLDSNGAQSAALQIVSGILSYFGVILRKTKIPQRPLFFRLFVP